MAESLARASSAVAGRSRGGVSSTEKPIDRIARALAVPQVSQAPIKRNAHSGDQDN
jgi:hypothetical protein